MPASHRTRALTAAALSFAVATVCGGIALQLAAGGIHSRSLGPAVLAVCIAVLGTLVVLHRPGMRLGPVLLVNGVAFGLGTLGAGVLDYGAVDGIAQPLAKAAFAVVQLTLIMNAVWALFILWFPDGDFASSGWRRFFAVGLVVTVALALAAWLLGPSDRVNGFYAGTSVPHGAGGPFADSIKLLGPLVAATLLFPAISLVSVVRRRRGAGPVVRQQIDWLLVALAIDVAAQIASVPFAGRAGWAGGLASAVSLITTPVPVAAAAIAILRYRLWEIDLVVSRALVYGVLWVALSALLLIPSLTAGLLIGGRDALAAVAIALVVTVVFQPARTRIERVVERLVYRHRAPAYVLLTELWETLRTADFDRLGIELPGAIRRGLGVAWAGIWLYDGSPDGGSLRPLGGDGADLGTAAAIPRQVAEQLRQAPDLVLAEPPPAALLPLWPNPPSAVVPLVAAERLVGLLACGQRRGDPLGARDYELLELLARECALRLRNLRLEGDLRERIVEIEAQAAALRRSRRRLVSAQDEERRRIERNLHDGVQQQLVALAVYLKQAAAGKGPPLERLAGEAEEAVFALQDLARGIFPGVLVDQGLAAALRTQTARMPLAVNLEVDPQLEMARLGSEVEAALYFVALEALTNIQKHAPAATAVVRLAEEDGRVALEVADDGPGFDAGGGGGSGLQNMEDRIAAAGGTFDIDSRVGGGTRIRATAPTRVSGGRRLAQVDEHRRHTAVQLGLRGQA